MDINRAFGLRFCAVDTDDVSPKLLKLVSYVLPIEHIFNLLMHGVFSAEWKSAVVCPEG